MSTFRNFDGIDDWIRLNPGGVDATGAWTYLALIRPETISGNDMIIAVDDNLEQPSPNYWFGLTAGKLRYHFTSEFDSTSAVAANKWWLVAASRPAGAAQTIRFHFKNLTDNAAWTHENGGTVSDQASASAGDLQIGAYGNLFDFFDGDISMVAAYESNLSDGNLEAIVSNATALALTPAGMWVLDQADVATDVDDETGGGATEKSLSGTTVSSGTIPNWDVVAPGGEPFPSQQEVFVSLAWGRPRRTRSFYTKARVVDAASVVAPSIRQMRVAINLAAQRRRLATTSILRAPMVINDPDDPGAINPGVCPVLTPESEGSLSFTGESPGSLSLSGESSSTLTLIPEDPCEGA